MADEKQKIKEYFDGVQPSEDFTRRLLELEQRERAPEAAPRPIPLRRRWAPAAVAAGMVLVSLAGLRLLEQSRPEPPLPTGTEHTASGTVTETAGTEPVEGITDSTAPGTDPVPTVTDPVPPVTNTVPPVTEPIPPVTEPLPPVTDPAPPVTEPIPSVTEPLPPVTDPAPPVTEPLPPVTEPVPPVTEPPVPGAPEGEYVTGDSLGWDYALQRQEGRVLLRVTDRAGGGSCTLDLTDQWTEEGFYEGRAAFFGQERDYRVFPAEGPEESACLLLVDTEENDTLP
ncbi:MAG: hypothetical protein IKQ04_00950 [Oscillospiraceae bacterium]|nr:hypothetical protein [Oscillospiraceae bacterium]